MTAYLWVALGSALGGVARYGFGLTAVRLWGEGFPWSTIVINVVGSFVIGCFGTLTLPDGAIPASPGLRLFVMVGFCGGFTTFSSFSLQTLSLARDGAWWAAGANVVFSVVLCLLAVGLGHVSAERLGRLRAEVVPAPRGVLALLDRRETARPVLAAASLAAARLGGLPITVLHLRPDAAAGFMATEEVMTGERRREVAAEASGLAGDLRAAFEAWRQGSETGTWREMAGEPAAVVAGQAGAADLVVLGRAPDDGGRAQRSAAHAALFDARRPTLLVPESEPLSLGRHVAVAWKPSGAADRAVTAALPLLRRAERVWLLVGAENGGAAAVTEAVTRRLARARVSVEVVRFSLENAAVGDALLARAHALDADLLVMGAYTHGELAERVFGGATRAVLSAADLPVLMRH